MCTTRGERTLISSRCQEECVELERKTDSHSDYCFCVCLFVALRPKSTAMAMAGWSVHLHVPTLFPGQA